MQPDNENLQQNNVNVPSSPPMSPEPMSTPPVEQYVQPQTVQSPTSSPAYQQPVTSSYAGGYFNTLKTLGIDPKSYFKNSPASLAQALIFPAINLAVMLLVLFVTNIVSTLTAPSLSSDTSSLFDKLSGDFWGQLFKGLGLSSLYIAIFLVAIAGIIMVVALIAKKSVAFKDVLSMSSIFSINFLAVSAASIIGLLSIWIDNADFGSIISLITSLITSLVFIYAVVLIIEGITEVTGFNLIKSTAIFVTSTILLVFIGGKIVKELPTDFNVTFGGYSNSVSGSSQIITSIRSALNSFNF